MSLRQLLIFIMALNTFSISATEKSNKEYEEIWKAGTKFVPLIRNEKEKLLFSSECKKKKCDAFSKTEKIVYDPSKISNSGGKNPGAIICKDILNQNIIYLKDMHGNENTFCLFPDKSFISTSSLTARSIKIKVNSK